MTIPYSGKHMRFGVQEGAAFGTAIADDQAFIETALEPFIIDPDIKHRAPNRSSGVLYPEKLDVWNDTKGSVPKLTAKGIALKKEIALWLYLLFQNVTEAATTPFQKTFTFPSVGPDFSANAGEFITLISRAPVSSVSEKISSAICQKLSFILSPTSGGGTGNLEVEMALIGKGWIRTSNPSGTWTRTATAAADLFNFHNFNVCTLDGSALVLESVRIDYEATWIPVGADGSGGIQNFALAGVSASVNVVGMWDANSRAGLTALDAGSEVVFILGWGSTGVDGYQKHTIHGIVMPGSAHVLDDNMRVNLNIKGMADVTNTEAPASVEIADAKDWAW